MIRFKEIKDESGFSLVELLLVVAILGVLTAMGFSYYTVYKVRALDARSLASLRRLIEVQENHFVDNEEFATALNQITNWIDENQVTTVISAADGDSWAGYSYHSGGNFRHCFDTEVKRGIVSIPGKDSACVFTPAN